VPGEGVNGVPESKKDAEALATLARLRRAMLRYPMAVQAGFSALAAEGRAFADTPDGADWRRRLGYAKAMGHGRMVWETLSLGSFTEKPDGPLPSAMIDALATTLRRRHIEPLLARLFGGKA
jgi:hypothetical protein